MISHYLYAPHWPYNCVARPVLVFATPFHLQRNRPYFNTSFWAPSRNRQSHRWSPSRIFGHLITPQSTSCLIQAATSSPPHVQSTTIRAYAPFSTSCSLVHMQAIHPPPPRICGSPAGPPITGPRIKVRDGRHLAYKEHGVPKEMAKYKIVLVHGFGSSRHEAALATAAAVQDLGVYLVSFDRPGYGESDPDPNRTFRSIALDIEELADQLELGSKFYVIGFSMGGQVVWGCLKYISHRLAGAALVAPVINYWWPGFPSHLSREAYNQQLPQDQWALRVAHYAPWLVYWWNTQKLFPSSSVAAGKPKFSRQDIELLPKLGTRQSPQEYVTQQGEFEAFHRDMIVGFGKCEFDPMDLKNPFPDGEGSVHLWHGDEDGLVPVTLQRYIAEKLPWIYYHEVPGAGHLLSFADDVKEAIIKALLIGEK